MTETLSIPNTLTVPVPQFLRTFDPSQPGEINSVFADGERYTGKDRPRAEARVKVRIVIRNCNNLGLPHGFIASAGTSETYCYLSELPLFQAMVEPRPDWYADAQEEFINDVCAAVATAVEPDHRFRDMKLLDMPARIDLVRARTNVELNKVLDKELATAGFSPESIFQARRKRGVLPLVSCEVIGDLPMCDQLPELATAKLAGTINAPLVSALQDMLAEMQKQNAVLIAALTEKNKGKV